MLNAILCLCLIAAVSAAPMTNDYLPHLPEVHNGVSHSPVSVELTMPSGVRGKPIGGTRAGYVKHTLPKAAGTKSVEIYYPVGQKQHETHYASQTHYTPQTHYVPQTQYVPQSQYVPQTQYVPQVPYPYNYPPHHAPQPHPPMVTNVYFPSVPTVHHGAIHPYSMEIGDHPHKDLHENDNRFEHPDPKDHTERYNKD